LPRITTVQPQGIPCTQDTGIAIYGVGFEAGSTVTLVNCDTGDELTVDATVLGEGEIRGTLPAQPDCSLLQGLYRVEVTGPSRTLETVCSIYLTDNSPPELLDVSPPYAYAGDPMDGLLSDRQVALTGRGFISTPSVRLVRVGNPTDDFECTLTAFVNETSMTAVVPSESRSMPVGEYHVYLNNPDLLGAQWLVDTDADGVGDEPGVFTVMGTPPPDIDALDPERPAGNTCPLDLEITGTGFTGDSIVLLLVTGACPNGTTQYAPGQCRIVATCEDADDPGTCSGTRLVADLTTCPPQGFYPVRVLNADGQHDTYYFLEVTESAGQHWNDPFVTEAITLATGRQRLAAVSGYDASSGAHLYVVGGIDSTRQVRDDVERAPVSMFGELGPFAPTEQYFGPAAADLRRPNPMTTPRHGHALVRVGRWLYALGGASADTFTDPATTPVPALATVERARILGQEGVPLVGTPQPAGPLGLAPGSWYYRVSAISATEGESLGSTEVSVSGLAGQLEICWVPVAGATTYNLYRSLAADGRAGTARLLAAGQAGTADGGRRCWIDDGVGPRLAAPGWLRATPQAGGTLAAGAYTYRVSAVRGGQETLGGYAVTATVSGAPNASLLVRWSSPTNDPAVDAGITYNLYRTPAGQPNGTPLLLASGLTSRERLDDGSATPAGAAPRDGVAPLPPGTLSYWGPALTTNGGIADLLVPREGLDAVAARIVDGKSSTTDDPVFIYAAGGRSSNATTDPATYQATLERIRVYPDGTLDDAGFVLEPQVFTHPRAFFTLLTNAPLGTSVPPPDQPPCAIPDADGDGYIRCDCGGDDCNDNDASVHPGAPEQCGDGIDQDCDGGCDGGTDLACPDCDPAEWDLDGDGHLAPPCGDDCNDQDATVYPGATEALCDNKDQDCDGADHCPVVPGAPPRVQMDRAPVWTWTPVLERLGDRPPVIPPAPPETTDPLYLLALTGDESYDAWPGLTTGTGDVDVCRIDNTGSWDATAGNYNPSYGGLVGDCDGNGATSLWKKQLNNTRETTAQLASRALLYGGGLFVFGGLTSETQGTSAVVKPGSPARTVFTASGDPLSSPSGLISNFTSTGGAGLVVKRGHFAVVRIAGRVFIFGGTTTGLNALSSIESLPQ
jgi:hypothetical protein